VASDQHHANREPLPTCLLEPWRKLGPISKQGDQYLRRILIVGAHSVLRRARQQPQKYPWLTQLLARRPFKVVAVALANKMARIAWALLARGGTYRAPQLVAV
jgi:transposase